MDRGADKSINSHSEAGPPAFEPGRASCRPGEHSRLVAWLLDIPNRRPPDFLIGGSVDPYIRRWWVIPRNRWFNIYLHHFLRSDDDRAHHDHPWWNLSVLLRGAYVEHSIQPGGIIRKTRRQAGEIKFRRATAAHRIELTDGPCWTLFITGPVIRNWGFHCPNAGWIPWGSFVDDRDKGAVGRGCGEQ